MNETPPASEDRPRPTGSAREVALLFLRLGLTAFGGPAAHIALFRDEVVTRRRWVTDAEFLDLLAASNLIPGPNSTEMAIHLGYVRAGWRGLVAGGTAFILPAFLIVLGVAALYARYGETPAVQGLLYGIEPVVIAVIAQAIWGLGRTAVKGWLLALVGAAAFGLYFLNVHELLLLFGGGLLVMLARNGRRLLLAMAYVGAGFKPAPTDLMEALWRVGAGFKPAPTIEAAPVALVTLFLTFLKIGAVLYGSGYVLVAFLQTEFVERLGWIGSEQLLDAVAVGQFTPGPVFTTATFIGYLVAGAPGAVLATVGIFLPGFVFVAVTNPFIPRLRRSPWLAALLDGVVAASLGLMAAVAVELARG
uniref:chromate efflux transporter n=1 Tax=Promineifilum sp. TaxID=2664178 RepID=UPI0035AFADC8